MQKSEVVKSYAKSIRRQIKFHTQHLSCNSKGYAVKPKFHLLRYVTTHNDSLSSPYILVWKVIRDVSRMLHSKCNTSVTTSATGAIRNLVYNVYKVMIAVIRFNKRINSTCELK